MNNPNRHNNFTYDDVMDLLDEEADNAIKLDIEAEAKKTKEAIWEEGMSGSEKKQANEDWRDYLGSRPGSGEDLNLEDSFDAYDNEQVDSRAEFLSKASYVELALAARDARQNGYDAKISDEILFALEDRIVEDSKYDLLDPEYEIESDHPEYGRREEQLSNLIEDMSVYYAIADPENDPMDYIDESNELLVADSGEGDDTSHESVKNIIPRMTQTMKSIMDEIRKKDAATKARRADAKSNAAAESEPDNPELSDDDGESGGSSVDESMRNTMREMIKGFEPGKSDSEDSEPTSSEPESDPKVVSEDGGAPDEGEAEPTDNEDDTEVIDFDKLDLTTMAKYKAHRRGINQRRRAELKKVPRSNRALRKMINSIAIKQRLELKKRLTPEVAGSIKAKVYVLSGGIADRFRTASALRSERRDELAVAMSDFKNQDKLLDKLPDPKKREDAKKLARAEYNELADSIKKRYRGRIGEAMRGSDGQEVEPTDQDDE